MFTNILLLNNGEVSYFGPGIKIVDFFGGLGMMCEPHYNPADFILEQLKAGPENARALVDASYKLRFTDDWPIELKKADEFTVYVDSSTNYKDNEVRVVPDTSGEVATQTTTNGIQMTGIGRIRYDTDGPDAVKEVDVESYIEPDATWQTGFSTQYVTLTKRNFLRQKHRYFSKLNFTQVLFMAVFAGLVWFQTSRTEETSKDRLGILFFAAVQFGFLPAMDAVTACIE